MKYAMELIEAGTFLMGSPKKEASRYNSKEERGNNERIRDETRHRVTLTKPFYMGKYAVTQAQYKAVMGDNPSYFDGDNFPVEQVSWYDALVFCNMLSIQEHLTPVYTIKGSTDPDDWGTVPYVRDAEDYYAAWDAVVCDWNVSGYRLPTEAEWEYAARGGADYQYAERNDPDELAWYKKNSGETTHHVGKKKPNSLGLYDMSGNVWEWCWDWYDEYKGRAQTDPRGAAFERYTRVLRGGCWVNDAVQLRPGHRNSGIPDGKDDGLGFRLVRSVV
jgi:formylglycine-generating enzyme required for sulfatase activity